MKKIIIFALCFALHSAIKASVPSTPAFPTPEHVKVPTYRGGVPIIAEGDAASLRVERAFAELPRTGLVTPDMEDQFKRHLAAAQRLIETLEKRGQLGHFTRGEKDQVREAVAYQLAILINKYPDFTPINQQRLLDPRVTTLSDFTVSNERAWRLDVPSDDEDFGFVPSSQFPLHFPRIQYFQSPSL